MAKQKKKTVKAVAKRVRKTKGGKIKVRKAGQDHFNARESGKKMRNKRRDRSVSESDKRNIERAIQN